MMNLTEVLMTMGLILVGTLATRYLPFVLFPAGRAVPKFVQYLGKALPAAVLGMLVVYCYKDVPTMGLMASLPALLSGALVIALQCWRKNLFLSLLGGTAVHMLLITLI